MGVGLASALQSNEDVADALIHEYGHLLRFPTGRRLEEVQNAFKAKGFAGCVGAIDCIHVYIDTPKGMQLECYYHHTGDFLVVVQVVCDRECRIVSVFVGCPGSVHDSRALHLLPLYRNTTSGQGVLSGHGAILDDGRHARRYLLGGAGYPLLPWIMIPMGRFNWTSADSTYDECHTSARSCIERTFGRLKSVWQNFIHTHITNLKTLRKEIMAVCILHNLIIDHGVEIDPALMNDSSDSNGKGPRRPVRRWRQWRRRVQRHLRDLNVEAVAEDDPSYGCDLAKRIMTSLVDHVDHHVVVHSGLAANPLLGNQSKATQHFSTAREHDRCPHACVYILKELQRAGIALKGSLPVYVREVDREGELDFENPLNWRLPGGVARHPTLVPVHDLAQGRGRADREGPAPVARQDGARPFGGVGTSGAVGPSSGGGEGAGEGKSGVEGAGEGSCGGGDEWDETEHVEHARARWFDPVGKRPHGASHLQPGRRRCVPEGAASGPWDEQQWWRERMLQRAGDEGIPVPADLEEGLAADPAERRRARHRVPRVTQTRLDGWVEHPIQYDLDMAYIRFFVGYGIPFNVARSEWYLALHEVYLSQFKAPYRPHQPRSELLRELATRSPTLASVVFRGRVPVDIAVAQGRTTPQALVFVVQPPARISVHGRRCRCRPKTPQSSSSRFDHSLVASRSLRVPRDRRSGELQVVAEAEADHRERGWGAGERDMSGQVHGRGVGRGRGEGRPRGRPPGRGRGEGRATTRGGGAPRRRAPADGRDDHADAAPVTSSSAEAEEGIALRITRRRRGEATMRAAQASAATSGSSTSASSGDPDFEGGVEEDEEEAEVDADIAAGGGDMTV
ncbi:hypothetical protein CBR_g36461 [Chara braunii]|uniref:DDE Tnp4 domain-containing protein n=1 Tax=Chara braunii TaxID=69332 RepID=A0A388LKV3_CHABU|nr:hypothetical protein CBR_g36461 [Chara braunii]|eukprot:GBG82934.1 hypothetical protein CBR_g36461 [Chara braunii]